MSADRNEVIAIRLTSDERDLIKRAATSEALSLSSWLRMVAIKAAKKVGVTKSGT